MPTPINQLLSRTLYATDGSTTEWDFSFSGGYISKSHVKAFIEAPSGERTEIIVTEDMLTGPFTLRISPALPPGDILTVYRDTPKDLPLVDFTDESGFSEVSLDTSAKQSVFIAAETVDTVNTSSSYDAEQAASQAATSASLADASADAAALAALSATNSANAATVSANASLAASEAAAASAEAAADEVAELISAVAAPAGASLIGYLPAGTGAVATTVQSKLRESVSVKDFGAVGDGVTDDTVAVQAAVTVALADDAQLIWPAGDYLTTASIPSFHAVRHSGLGAVKRGSDVYSIQPRDTDTNIIYVSASGSAANDGLSASQPATIAKAFSILKEFGSETLNGVWRIQMAAGTYNDAGVTLAEMPLFKNKLEIFGAHVDEALSAVPSTVWDGVASGSAYAVRLDASAYPSAFVNMFIKNIKLQNWASGGVVIWAHGNVLVHNIHTDACPIGLWLRHGYFRVLYGIYNNCSTWGVGIQYNGTANIGSLTAGSGVTFTNCSGEGVNAGRFVVCYVQRCTFSGNGTNIKQEWLARVRTQGNVLGAPTFASISMNGNSLFTDDNGAGYPNTLPILTEAAPFARTYAGSVNPLISRYGQRALHNYAGVALESGASPVTTFSVATTSQVLLSDPAYGGPDFVPFRLPAYALYSPTFELEIELGITLNANAGGTLAFHGQGPAASTKLCEIAIPASASLRSGFLKMRVMNIPNNSSARFEVFYPATGKYVSGVTVSLNNTGIRDSGDNTLVFRLYWTSLTTDAVTFYGMRTYVVE